MYRKNFFSTAIVFLATILAVFFFIAFFQIEPNKQNPGDVQNNEISLTALELQRKNYGFSTAIFEELPNPPKYFFELVSLIHAGKYQNYPFFGREFFLQPEFFPSFKENAFSYWLSPSPTHYAAAGYGFFPSIQQVELKPEETKTVAFFMHAGWGVQSVQGTKIAYSSANQWIDIEVIEPEFLLEESFPKFSKNWARKIVAKISATAQTVPGTYEIVFFAQNPSPESRQKWSVGSSRPYFDIQAARTGANAKIFLKVS